MILIWSAYSVYIYKYTNIHNVYNMCICTYIYNYIYMHIHIWIHFKHIKGFLRRFPLGKPSRNSGISTSVAATRTPHSDAGIKICNWATLGSSACFLGHDKCFSNYVLSKHILHLPTHTLFWIVCYLRIFQIFKTRFHICFHILYGIFIWYLHVHKYLCALILHGFPCSWHGWVSLWPPRWAPPLPGTTSRVEFKAKDLGHKRIPK